MHFELVVPRDPGSGVCPVAARARRFAVVNDSCASLWAAGLAMLVFSFAAERRFRNMHPLQAERVWQRTGFLVGVVTLCFAALAVFQFGQFSGVGWHSDIVCLFSLFAVFTMCFSDIFTGEVIYAAAMTFEQVALTQECGFRAVFEHLTHVSLFLMLSILWLHILVCVLRFVLERWFRFELRRDSLLNAALGVLATAGASLAFALFLASALLIASSNGTLPTEGAGFRNNSVNRFVLVFGLDHFVPLFVFAPLYAARWESGAVGEFWRKATWILVVVVDVALYFRLLALWQASPPTAAIMQMGPLAPAAAAALLAWISGGFA